MAGHQADGVFWLQPGFGFTTYLRAGETAQARLAPVAAVNARFAATWTRRPAWTYRSPDCRAKAATWRIGETAWTSQLPPVGWGTSGDKAAIARDVMASPIPDELTAAAASHLVDYYRLGRGPGVDLLAVSFSATDFVGHRYGTDGPEMCEQLHRLDAALGTLLAKLDRTRVPYLVVLSADHGGSDFAARLQAKGYAEARAVDGRGALARANRALMAEFRLEAPPLSGSIEEVFVAAPPGVDRARLETAAAAAVAAQPEVAAAFSQAELLATPIPAGKAPDELTLKERFAESTYRGRSADVLAALRPYTVGRPPSPGAYLAGHGAPWDYDRKVPILFWWPGAPAQERPLPVETVDIAPTLAAVIGLTPPPDVDGRCRPLGTDRCPATP
jgi:predicted AlkP superfamily pyrophosphatase or phosphodiesterase